MNLPKIQQIYKKILSHNGVFSEIVIARHAQLSQIAFNRQFNYFSNSNRVFRCVLLIMYSQVVSKVYSAVKEVQIDCSVAL